MEKLDLKPEGTKKPFLLRPWRLVYFMVLMIAGVLWIGWPAVVLIPLASFDIEIAK